MARPGRTRSKWVSGRVRVAAELARCRQRGRSPARSTMASPSWKTASWRSVVGWPGESAYTKWLHTPTTSTRPSACAFAAASSSAGQSATVAPPRDSPVSILRCRRAGRPASRLASIISSSCARLAAPRSTPAATPSCSGNPGASSQASTGTVTPARRRVSASSRVQTPSQSAPASSAARAAGSMPWPYPSAFTTAINSAVVPERSLLTFSRIASRSTRTSACHMRPAYFPP